MVDLGSLGPVRLPMQFGKPPRVHLTDEQLLYWTGWRVEWAPLGRTVMTAKAAERLGICAPGCDIVRTPEGAIYTRSKRRGAWFEAVER